MPEVVAHTAVARDSVREKWVARLTGLVIAGIALYVLLDVVAQALPPHYNPVSQAESDLAVGPYGFIMTANFVVRGLLSAAMLLVLVRIVIPSVRSRFGLLLFALWTASSFLLAVFPTDVVGSEHTLHGKIHLGLALIGFAAIALAEPLLSVSFPDTGPWAAARQPAQVIAWGTLLSVLLFILVRPRWDIGGLVERVFLGFALLWMLIVAWRLRTAALAGA